MDIPTCAGKNLRTQIWGGKDRGLITENGKPEKLFFHKPANLTMIWAFLIVRS